MNHLSPTQRHIGTASGDSTEGRRTQPTVPPAHSMDTATTALSASARSSQLRQATFPPGSFYPSGAGPVGSGGPSDGTAFPWKLHEMLEAAEREDFQHVVSWLPGNKAFKVHDSKAFAAEIIPKYLSSMTKYKSFVRQLNLYCFERVTKGPDRGSYHHPNFVRERKFMCNAMGPKKFKGGPSRGAVLKRPSDKSTGSSTTGKKSRQNSISSANTHPSAEAEEEDGSTVSSPPRLPPAPQPSHIVMPIYGDEVASYNEKEPPQAQAELSYFRPRSERSLSLPTRSARTYGARPTRSITSSTYEDFIPSIEQSTTSTLDPSTNDGSAAPQLKRSPIADGDVTFFEGKTFHFVDPEDLQNYKQRQQQLGERQEERHEYDPRLHPAHIYSAYHHHHPYSHASSAPSSYPHPYYHPHQYHHSARAHAA